MFELNGKEYSFNDIYNKAQDEGVSFQEYLEFLKTKGLVKKTIDVATQDAPVASTSGMASNLEDTSSESTDVIDTFFGVVKEYAEAVVTGFKTGRAAEEFIEVQKGNHNEESIQAMIDAGEKLSKLPQSDRMQEYAKKVQEAGGGFWNGLWLLAKEDKILASQVALQSVAMMAGAIVDSGADAIEGKTPDVLATMAAGAGAGAGTYAAGGAAVGFLFGGIGAGPGAAAGAKMGTVAGAIGGLSTSLEMGLTFVDLLREEIEAKGLEYNKENIVRFLNKEENYLDFKNKSVNKG